MLTMLPPTFARKNRPGGANGANSPFFAYYWRDHPYAAAIAAQEVREARYKMPFALVAMLAFGAAYYFAALHFGWYIEFAPLAAALGTAITKLPPIGRAIELRGQSVECVVRADLYGTPLDEAVDDATRQLARYDQFDGWDELKIETGIVRAIPEARRWANSNHKLIARARELQRG